MLRTKISIATRLAIASFLWSSIILIDAAAFLYHLYYRSVEQAFDNRLAVHANTLAAGLSALPAKQLQSLEETGGDIRFNLPYSGWYWEIHGVSGETEGIFRSRSLLGGRLYLPRDWEKINASAHGAFYKGYGYSADGKQVRILERKIQLPDQQRFQLFVAGDALEISKGANSFFYVIIITFSLLGLGWIVTTIVQIQYGLKPLKDLRRSLSQVRTGNLEQVEGCYSDDIAPLAEEINLLLTSNKEILERARTQVGNLAHALKTPLTVINNEIRDLDSSVSSKIEEQIAIIRRQMDYHLKRAQAAAGIHHSGIQTSVNDTVDAFIRTFEKIYHEGPVIHAYMPEQFVFSGESQDFQEILGNVIDNACKWGKETVSITCEAFSSTERKRIRLRVEDDGIGIDQEDISLVIQRGKRLDETQPGTGLGLSIVDDLVSLYHGHLSFKRSDLGGLCVILELPGEQKNSSV